MYQGWAEPGIPPGHIVKYYAQVQAQTLTAATSVRLFMVPGMGHCGGGDGASTFDMVTALDGWVESGTAPEQIPASRVRNGSLFAAELIHNGLAVLAWIAVYPPDCVGREA